MTTKKQLIEWVRQKVADETIPASELADYQLFVNLSGKGKSITAAEKRQLKKLLIELESRYESEKSSTPRKSKKKWIASSAEMIHLFGVSRESLSKYVKGGMPRIAYGKYPVKECLDWWLDNIYKGAEQDEDMVSAKRRYWTSKADEQEIKVSERRGEYMRVEHHESIFNTACGDLRNTMLNLPARVLPNDTDARKRLRDEIITLLDSFSRHGTFAMDSVEQVQSEVSAERKNGKVKKVKSRTRKAKK